MRKTLASIAAVIFALGVVAVIYILTLSQQPKEMTLEDASEIVPAASSVSLTAESVADGVLLRWRDMEGVSVEYYAV